MWMREGIAMTKPSKDPWDQIKATIGKKASNGLLVQVNAGMDERAHGSIFEAQMDDVSCPACDGTGNFYRHDEDGDFLERDHCNGSGKLKAKERDSSDASK
jgi:DnaJ-class molecular chaperone